jgi:hypothetical protein
MFSQISQHVHDFMWNESSEAFFFPQRLWSGFLIASFSAIYIAYKLWYTIHTLAENFRTVNQATPIRNAFNVRYLVCNVLPGSVCGRWGERMVVCFILVL